MKKIGFSSGVMFRKINPASDEIVDAIYNVTHDAIEISLIGGELLNLNNENLLNKIRRFEYISIHAPCNTVYRNDTETRVILDHIEKICRTIKVDTVVFHPDLFHDLKVFRDFQIPMAIENMDFRKKFGNSVNELANTMDELGCGFVLDINHAYSIDPSMQMTKDLIERFSNDMVEIHASAFVDYHEPFFQNDQEFLLDDIEDLDLPIILEPVIDRKEDIQKEYDFVRNYLN